MMGLINNLLGIENISVEELMMKNTALLVENVRLHKELLASLQEQDKLLDDKAELMKKLCDTIDEQIELREQLGKA